MKLIVTGGCGFIGSALVLRLIQSEGHQVLNLDKLTYAANPKSLSSIESDPAYSFHKLDLACDKQLTEFIRNYEPDAIFHLAAETHVDRSIEDSDCFVTSNVIGTHCLLESTREYLAQTSTDKRDSFRLIHVSTDEVYGQLGANDSPFTEESSYNPRSPYAATKAACDHLIRAWQSTYGFPAIITACSNNYGPRQFPEKLIPFMVTRALKGQSLPLYGDGQNIRDWIHVEDHVDALLSCLTKGVVGETYNIGGSQPLTNLEVIQKLCALLDRKAPDRRSPELGSYDELIRFVNDRPGHDRRYEMDTGKIRKELGWKATRTFDAGLEETLEWYLSNEDWWTPLINNQS